MADSDFLGADLMLCFELVSLGEVCSYRFIWEFPEIGTLI